MGTAVLRIMRRLNAKLQRFDWWLAGICLSRSFNAFVFMTYAAALPVLQDAWKMSAAAAGSIPGGFQIGYALSLVFCSALADRFGPKHLFLGSMSAGAVFSMGFALFARDYLSGLTLYVLVALSLGGNYTTGLMILAGRYPTTRRGMAIGSFIASTSLGYALSLLVSGWALPAGGYKLAFLLTCMGPLVGAILAWITVLPTSVPKSERRVERRFSKEVIGNRPAMLLIAGYVGHAWELLGMWAWMPAFLAACIAMGVKNGTLEAAGLGSYLTAFFHVMGLFASFVMGSLSDRLGRARVILVLAGVSAACSFVFGWSIAWPFYLTVCIGVVYGFSAIGDSPVLSTALTETVEPSILGSTFGLRSLLGFGAGAVSPLVFGVVLDLTNPTATASAAYSEWGWAFATLGVGGLAATWTAFKLVHSGHRGYGPT
jgi:MFS family permease